MLMSWIFTGMMAVSLIAALILGNGSALAGSMLQGAQSGVTLAISLAGAMCLWTGVGKLMEKCGISVWLSRLFAPLLGKVFPTFHQDPVFAGSLSANVCANFLGLGNAATPMGIQAAKQLAAKTKNGTASAELCRLIVLNTASIQLIPANVAAVRAGLGCSSPFDILPAVWITSLCSASLGVVCAVLLERVWRK